MRKHCKCGYQLDVLQRWNGLSYVPFFVADQEGKPEQGLPVIHCPGCGDQLRSDELLSAYEANEMKWRDRVCCEPPGSATRLFPLYEVNGKED